MLRTALGHRLGALFFLKNKFMLHYDLISLGEDDFYVISKDNFIIVTSD